MLEESLEDTAGEGSPDQAQDIAYGGSGNLGSTGFTGYRDPDALMTPGEEVLVTKAIKAAAKRPEDVPEDIWDTAGGLVERGVDLPSDQPDILTSKHGYFRINPAASWWDWFTALPEMGINTIGTAVTGGIASPDFQLGTGDVLQYVDPSGKPHSDISQYMSGIPGPQAPGSLQVDLGLSPLTLATIGIDPNKPVEEMIDVTSSVPSTIKSLTDYYDKYVTPNIPGLATGGLASLPQISQSGLYRAMGRG